MDETIQLGDLTDGVTLHQLRVEKPVPDQVE
jgi:hypothetical protein